MIRRVVDFALTNRLLIIAVALLLFAWGAISFHNLPVDAYPDVADNYVNIITQWPGHSAEDIEKQITVPTEIQMAGLPDMKNLRSFSLAGISSIIMNFNDSSDNNWNRERVLERMTMVTLPAGLTPQLQTDWSPAGQIYWYTVESKNPHFDVMEQKSVEDWTLEKQFKSVPGIVDVASFGGLTKEYQIRLDPDKLVSYGLSIAQVEQQLSNNNTNAGGSFIVAGAQQINVQAVGLFANVQQIENTVIKTQNGTPLRVKDIAIVEQGPKIRLGQISKTYRTENGQLIDNPDVVEGALLLQKGADADPALRGIEAKVTELNGTEAQPAVPGGWFHRAKAAVAAKHGLLPPGVKVVPFLDRSDLIHVTTHTVLHNLTEGIVLVVIILMLFLGNVRGAIIVALTIPFALLFASICLDLRHIPANLLSLGALDFGMVVDGAVVMIENIVRHLNRPNHSDETPREKIRAAAHEVQRPVFYAIGIIITAYLPIFTLQAVEGRLFKPMAWTVAFALLGALIYSMIVAPVLATFMFRKEAKEWHNPVMDFLTATYRKRLGEAIEHRWITVGIGVVSLGLAIFLLYSGVIGSEFLPHLDEGALWVRGSLAPSTGPDESLAISNQARLALAQFPEVTNVVSQIGRPDDGTDWTGFFNTEYFVDLKPKDQWRPVFHQDKDNLIASMNQQLDKIPGVIWGFSQPIEDNMEEAVSGVKGELSVKIYGDDLKTLEQKGNEVVSVMSKIPGVKDLGLFRIIGQPNLTFTVDRQAAARWGINVADVQDAIQTAVGGNAVSQVLQGEARFDLVLRYQKQYRDTRQAIENVRLLAPTGERVSLAQLTKIDTTDGAEEIYREGEQRYVAVKYSVRDRDLGSTVEEAIDRVNKTVQLPTGYHITWAGEYESKQRADKRLAIIVPLTILLIFIILYMMFKSFKWASLILMNVLMARVGGLLALLVTHTNISVSSSVGFLALFGVSVQTGVIMLEYMNQLRVRGRSIEESAIEGAVLRLRPIMMTMLVATLGLIPAAFSHGIGSDSQRPFAIVIVGGLISDLVLSIFLLPTLYVWIAGDHDVLPEPEPEFEA
ncbi:cobalt-zinc-cadmium resistance protein CzcA [Bryocella elongata]|uniref:Cobalt-zinc-cadmium resistance protein CzcA n=1 Tax=Bryocella elongata TaxID=863522 RepID=A0A1H5UTQ0_9BACT|nr:efflux RND transporter permease subunit [Bryocella elongata]SEF78443.1 cobalt-zinc-cadmium resistance protein CzcA [Bryocella elongata]